MYWVFHIVRSALIKWGYLAVCTMLLGENAGLPLPGEAILMFASFLSHKSTGLRLEWVILIGIGAAVAGDNIGYLLGRTLGPRIIPWLKNLFRLDAEDIEAAKNQIRLHGAATVFWARYIFGLRMIAGPLVGLLGMEWKTFFLYNTLGAVTWVTTMALVGYAFATQFASLLDYVEKVSWVIAGLLFAVGYFIWRRRKKQYQEFRKCRNSQLNRGGAQKIVAPMQNELPPLGASDVQSGGGITNTRAS